MITGREWEEKARLNQFITRVIKNPIHWKRGKKAGLNQIITRVIKNAIYSASGRDREERAFLRHALITQT
jgi:hypothetical protein